MYANRKYLLVESHIYYVYMVWCAVFRVREESLESPSVPNILDLSNSYLYRIMKLRIKPRKRGENTQKKTTKLRKVDKCGKTRVLKAIPDSGGLLTKIAERLDVSRATLRHKLELPDWDDVREVLNAERESVGDLAESTVQDAMRQRLDVSCAARVSQWYLERKHTERGFKDKKELTLEGGKNPLQIQNETVIRIEDLDLDIETRKKILAAIEAKEAQEKESTE